MEPSWTLKLDGRVVEGTATEIVEQMRSQSFGAQGMTLAEFIADTASNMFDDPTRIAGDTDDMMCRSLVETMIQTGMAVNVEEGAAGEEGKNK